VKGRVVAKKQPRDGFEETRVQGPKNDGGGGKGVEDNWGEKAKRNEGGEGKGAPKKLTGSKNKKRKREKKKKSSVGGRKRGKKLPKGDVFSPKRQKGGKRRISEGWGGTKKAKRCLPRRGREAQNAQKKKKDQT